MESKRNFTKFGLNMNPVVSFTSTIFILIFTIYALLNLDQANRMLNFLNESIVTNFDWLFILSSNFFVIVCFYLALTKLGNVRIGGIYSKPEFSNLAWYSMLISAGMGIGLMFWAVGEPLTHFVNETPIFESSDPAASAMASTFYHWGLHPWGIYALLALGLAYFSFNKKLPLSLRSVFYPFIKDRIYGVTGDIIDTFAVISTMFGLATSLGLGAQQINSGLDYMLGIGFSVNIQVGLIVIITLLATISVMAGIHKGVRFLSELTIKMAFVFMVAIFILGPTFYIIQLFSNSLGLYFSNIIQYASFVAIGDNSAWQADWTIFYLAWWISWSPFVGMFIARISKGRTIRELVLGVLLVPSLLSFFWLTVFGGTSIFLDVGSDGALFSTVQENYPVALFEMVSLLHIPFLTEIIRVIMFVLITTLVVSYFITSSDSGSLVVDKLTSGGVINSPRQQRVFWAVIEGLLAATLLLIGGEKALMALQTAVISAGLPLSIILILMSFSLIKGVKFTHEKQMKILDQKKFKQLFKTLSSDDPDD
ncbi:BCCT family transporter [Natranaerofaba carboxydovora]|uniref:BCCT family transporter n=1 Tax=Natranaerofaba carboxydovora TaxID=2742683 RepID=UPI001F139D5F|nr:BCCT family transporter [Natranaerofaba carboxydovora]UMZ72638.1 Glycine betaine/proline betaine transporter BetS [Natranaerofaba carboxydovora]